MTMSDFVTLARGERYPLPYTEGIVFESMAGSGHMLKIMMPDLDQKEIKEYRRGTMRAGVLYEDGIIMFVFKFGGQPWIEAPFNVRLIPAERLDITKQESVVERILLDIHLVDTATGILKGLRGTTLSPALTKEFIRLVHKQLDDPAADPAHYDIKLEKLYQDNPDPSNWVKRALITPCG